MKKDKEFFANMFYAKWRTCVTEAEENIRKNGGSKDMVAEIATGIFEESADADEVAGYYVVYHGDDALKDWAANTEGIVMTKQDTVVDSILKDLYQ